MRFGVAMPEKGGRTAIIGLEVKEARDAKAKLVHEFTVGFIDRVQPFTVDAARDRLQSLLEVAAEERPCIIIDVSSPQGLALHQELKRGTPEGRHRPHAYTGGVKERTLLFSQFLQSYSAGRVVFKPALKYRADLDRALVFYLGGGVRKHGVELEPDEEAMVVALGLAMTWPKHGQIAAAFKEAG